MALLLAALALGLPFIMNGPVNDEDILTPLPTPESTVTTITEDSKITAVPTQKPVAVTTKSVPTYLRNRLLPQARRQRLQPLRL